MLVKNNRVEVSFPCLNEESEIPNTLSGALAAMHMQEGLRLGLPDNGENRLVMRTVLSLGDLLHQEGTQVGDAVILVARIDDITPPDEISLSALTCMAVN